MDVAYCKQDAVPTDGGRRARPGRRFGAGLTALVLVALLGAACGDSEDDAADADEPTAEESADESTSTTSADDASDEGTDDGADDGTDDGTDGSTPAGDGATACASEAVAEAAALPADFGELTPGQGGAGEGAEPEECVFSVTSTDEPARHVTFGVGTSPYGMADPEELPNGARRSEVEDGFAAEVDTEGGDVVYVLGYGVTLAEFDGIASSL